MKNNFISVALFTVTIVVSWPVKTSESDLGDNYQGLFSPGLLRTEIHHKSMLESLMRIESLLEMRSEMEKPSYLSLIDDCKKLVNEDIEEAVFGDSVDKFGFREGEKMGSVIVGEGLASMGLAFLIWKLGGSCIMSGTIGGIISPIVVITSRLAWDTCFEHDRERDREEEINIQKEQLENIAKNIYKFEDDYRIRDEYKRRLHTREIGLLGDLLKRELVIKEDIFENFRQTVSRRMAPVTNALALYRLEQAQMYSED